MGNNEKKSENITADKTNAENPAFISGDGALRPTPEGEEPGKDDDLADEPEAAIPNVETPVIEAGNRSVPGEVGDKASITDEAGRPASELEPLKGNEVDKDDDDFIFSPRFNDGKGKKEAELVPDKSGAENPGVGATLPDEPGKTEPVEIISDIPIDQLRHYANNPFRIYVNVKSDDEEADGEGKKEKEHELVRSIREEGINERILARFTLGEKNESGKDVYEIISGHNRFEAAKFIGLPTVPVHVVHMEDDEADNKVVSANVRRTNICPSELGKAFKLRLDVLNRQGNRTDLSADINSTSVENKPKLSRDEVGLIFGMSGSTVRQYVRFTQLLDKLQEALDNKKILKSTAENLSYLSEAEQKVLLELLAERDEGVKALTRGLSIKLKDKVKEVRGLKDEDGEDSTQPPALTREDMQAILETKEGEKSSR